MRTLVISGNIDNGETRECTVKDYIVSLDEVSINGDSGIVLNMNNSQQHLYTNDISNTENKIKTSSSLTTASFITGVPTHEDSQDEMSFVLTTIHFLINENTFTFFYIRYLFKVSSFIFILSQKEYS